MKRILGLALAFVLLTSVSVSALAASGSRNDASQISEGRQNDTASISMESGTTYLLKKDPDYTPAILPNVYKRVGDKDTVILTLDDVIKIVSKTFEVLKNGTTRFIAVKYDCDSKKTYVISQIAEKDTAFHYLVATDILTKETVISSSYSMQAEMYNGGEIAVTDAFTQTQNYYSVNTPRFKQAIGDIRASSKAMWIQDGYLCVGDLYWLAMDLTTGTLFVEENLSMERAVTHFDFGTGFTWWLDNTKSHTNMYSKLTDVDGKINFLYSEFFEMYRVNGKIYAISIYNELCEIIPATEKRYSPSGVVIGYNADVKLLKDFSKTGDIDRNLDHNYQITADYDGNLVIYTEWNGAFITVEIEK